MGVIDNFRNILKRPLSKQESKQVPQEHYSINSTPDFGGARNTTPKFNQGSYRGIFGSLPKRSQKDLNLDERRFKYMDLNTLMDVLSDAHPDVSFAIWNFLRIGNSGFKVRVYKLNSENRYTTAEKDIAELFKRLKLPNNNKFEKSRDINKLINQLILSVVTRGAAACEVVLTPSKDDIAFIAPVDPATITFRYENGRYIPYQNGGTLSLDIPTFFYEGLDERIDDPYGRSPLISALNMVLFQLQVLNDIKAVVHNQGYPRFDIKIVEETLLARMPIYIRNNEEAKNEWLASRMQEIIDMYNDLEPDDTLVHFDSVEVGMVGGKGSGGAVIDPQKLMQAIDNLIMSGLKTLSTILGRRSTGNTESFAKLEIKLYLQGIKAIQEVVATILSRALMLYLNIKGKQGIVEIEFNPVEIRTELEQEQFRQIAFLNAAFARDQGWITQDDAANMAVGHDSVSDPDWDHIQPVKNKDGETPSGTIDTNPSAGGEDDTSSGN